MPPLQRINCGLLLAAALLVATGSGVSIEAVGVSPAYQRANAQRLQLQALAYLEEQRYQEAIATLQQAVRLNPLSAQSATLYHTLGKAYQGKQQWALATMSYLYATRLQPHFAPYYDSVVACWQRQGVLPTAERQLLETVQRAPQDSMAWYLLGVIYGAQQQWVPQQDAWQQFLTLAPASPLREKVCGLVHSCRGGQVYR